jgi:DNA-binding MarR family transcriptional regulator
MSETTIIENPSTDIVGEITRSCILTRIRRLSRVVTSIYDQALRPHDINAPQFSMLVLIARLGGATRAGIGRANNQERSTLTRNLQLLQSQRWIEEVPGKNGRGRLIVISKDGQDLLTTAWPAWCSAQAHARRLIGDDGATAITDISDRIPSDYLTG